MEPDILEQIILFIRVKYVVDCVLLFQVRFGYLGERNCKNIYVSSLIIF